MSTYVTDSGWCLGSLGSGKSAWHRRVTKGAASLLVRVYSVKPGVYGLKAYLTLGDVPGMPQGGKVLQRHFDAASLQDAKAAALLMLWDIGIALEDLAQARCQRLTPKRRAAPAPRRGDEMSQLEMFKADGKRVVVYGGYSWSYDSVLTDAGYADLISGIVVTPRWMPRMMQEPDTQGIAKRVIIDNGAYPAWVQGTIMTLSEQLDGIHSALVLRPDAEWIIAPDVVGDANRTWARINACAAELEQYGLHRLLLPLQDGMDVGRVVSLAAAYGAGIFVGGSTWRFKTEALRELQAHETRWVHVGRASSWAQLSAASQLGADSVDSTSFVRRFEHNVTKRSVYARSLGDFAAARASALTPIEYHYPKTYGFYR